MPRFEITSPEGQRFEIEVPEGATEAQVMEYAQSQFKPAQPKGDSLELAQEPSTLELLGGGFKAGLHGVAQGIGQAVGLTSREDVARTRAEDAPILDTTAGKIGNFAGQVAGYAPAAFIPGVNTVLGGGLVGAGIGALQPSASTKETIFNSGLGGVGGVAGSIIGKFLAARAAAKAAKASQAAPAIIAKNASLAEAHAAGYAVPPQDAGAGSGSQILNAISGKIKTEQKASVLNQSVTNSLAAKSIGLPEHEPITLDTIHAVRTQAGKAYEAIRGIGDVTTDSVFKTELGNITRKYQSASQDFPDLLNDEVAKIIQAVDKPRFNADSAVDAISVLRDKSTSAFRKGDNDIGSTARKAADAIEGMLGRHLQQGSAKPELVKNFQEARTLIAKTYAVEKALNNSTGNIKARVIAAEYGKGKPLTGDLEKIGKFASAFPRSNQELAGVNPYSVLDAAGAAGGMAINPTITAYVASRPLIRSTILSAPYQKAFVKGAVPKGAGSILRLGSKAAVPLSALGATKGNPE